MFRSRLILSGVANDAASGVVNDLREELEARTHFIEPIVNWDAERSVITIEVGNEDFDESRAAEKVCEEVLEALAGIVWDTEGLWLEPEMG